MATAAPLPWTKVGHKANASTAKAATDNDQVDQVAGPRRCAGVRPKRVSL